jgi:hypothetical protein
MLRPIVQGRRIEIRSIWPDDRMNLRIDAHSVENIEIFERPVNTAGENWPEINRPLHRIVELNRKPIWPNIFQRYDSIMWM